MTGTRSGEQDLAAAHELAQFVVSLDLANVDEAVRHKLRLHVLDSFGAGLAGVRSSEGEIVSRELWSPGAAVVWGSPRGCSPATAALINGTMAHAFEVDDTNGIDHSGAVVVSAAVAASSDDTSEGDFLAGVLAGYEVGRRVLDAVGGYTPHNMAGWHSTGTCGSFAAAATAARILGLDPQQTAAAIGIAGSFTGGVWAFLKSGAMTKRLVAGRAAEAGVTAALLARGGFTGPPTIFEEEWGGFLTTYSTGIELAPKLMEDLNTRWRIDEAAIKPYPCCRGSHAAIDAMLALRDQHDLRPETVGRVVVETPASIVRMCGEFSAETLLAAQMSLPFALAVALRDGAVELRSFGASARTDASLSSTAERIEVIARDDLVDAAAIVTVSDVGGQEYQCRIDFALGSRERPIGDEQVVQKFLELSAPVLDEAAAHELVDLTLSNPSHHNVARWLTLLRGSNGSEVG